MAGPDRSVEPDLAADASVPDLIQPSDSCKKTFYKDSDKDGYGLASDRGRSFEPAFRPALSDNLQGASVDQVAREIREKRRRERLKR